MDNKKQKRNFHNPKKNNCKDTSSLKFGAPQLSKPNDVSWYAKDAQLLKDSASFPFSVPAGAAVHLNRNSTYLTGLDYAVPGIMAFKMKPCIGKAEKPNDAINIAARNIYTFVRHQNSGHTNYEAADLMMYLIAMGEIYSFHSWCVRAYGIARLYQQTNKYLPTALLEAMGFDPSVALDLPRFRNLINLTRRKFAATAVPNSMPYINRKIWLYSGIYADAPGPKAQMYLFKPAGFYMYKFGELGKLVWTPMAKGAKLTLANLEGIAGKLIDPIMSDEDMGIMSGDILKAFGDSGIYKVAEMPEDYEIMPTYSTEVLSQIHNMTIWTDEDEVDTNPAWDITQNAEIGGGYLTTTNNIVAVKSKFGTVDAPYGTALPSYGFAGERLIDLHSEHPTPDEVMVATRCTTAAQSIKSEVTSTKGVKFTYTLSEVGADICLSADVYTFNQLGTLTVSKANPTFSSHATTVNDVLNGKDSIPAHVVRRICQSTNFNDGPMTVIGNTALAEMS
uniref:Capsid n=1 Tax=Macaque picobirnavirus 2 TaxID=2078800 RepID=A0A2L1FE40_9VIRU|nr:capsid [Macaque picobirnavirus 2]